MKARTDESKKRCTLGCGGKGVWREREREGGWAAGLPQLVTVEVSLPLLLWMS